MKLNRRQFLSLLGFGATACKNNDMQFAQHGIIGKSSGAPSGDVFLSIGDSVARGNSDAPGDDPQGTLFQYDTTTNAIVPVGDDDLLENQIGLTGGSQWPRFGREYYDITGRRATLIQTAIGGSGWYNATTGFSWYTNGALYSNAITKYTAGIAALTAMGITPTLKGVFINLGINDSVQNSHAQLYTYMTSLIDRINTDLSTPKIYITLPFRTGTFTNTQSIRLYEMRKLVKQLTIDYANAIGIGDNASFHMWDAATYWQPDLFHLTYAGNDLFGRLMARGMTMDPAAYEKETISITSSYYSNLNANRRTLINDFIASQKAAGNWDKLQRLHVYLSAGSDRDRLVNWRFTRPSFVSSVSGTYAGTGIITDGSTNHITSFAPMHESISMNYETDFIWGVRTGTTVPGSGVAAALFGLRANASGGLVNLLQTASNLAYYGGDTVVKNVVAETSLAANTLYSIARNGGTKYLYKGTTQVDSQAQASTALGSTTVMFSTDGARNNNDTVEQRMNVESIYGFTAKFVGFDLSEFYSDMEYIIAHWND